MALAPKASIAFALLQALSMVGWAVQLPVRTYTTADGLPGDRVDCFVPDSRGFLWLCTSEGLARFDGYQFRTYGVDQGLPSPIVNTFLETREGRLLVGTQAGLAVMKLNGDERTHSRFDVYTPGPQPQDLQIQVLFQDRGGVLWCGTSGGLFRVRWTGSSPHFERVVEGSIQDLAQDRAGNLWVAAGNAGLLEILDAGEIHRYGEGQGMPYFVNQGRHHGWVSAVAVDGEGSIWAGTDAGLCKVRPYPTARGDIVEHVYTNYVDEIRSILHINSLYVSRSGRLWVATSGGASQWTGDPKQPFRRWRAAEGISDHGVSAIGEDGAGNLWMATEDGARRIARDGLMTYSQMDGLAYDAVNGFTEGRNGALLAITSPYDSLDLNHFEGDRFTVIHPALPRHIRRGWGHGSIAFEDREGDWWVATGGGLCRFDGRGGVDAIARRPPKALYTRKDGLASDDIYQVFEDSRGDIWVATVGPASVSRWDRAAGAFQKPPLLAADDRMIITFAEDRAGNVWIGTSVFGFFRWRARRLDRIDRSGVPPESAAVMHFDRFGRLWLGNRQGLFRCDDPLKESPRFEKMLGEPVACVAEDRWSRIYACTGRGVACLDPASGRLRRFTRADGLGPGRALCAYVDGRGDIWFGLTLSVSRLTPRPDTPYPLAPVYITSVRSSGREMPIAERGETAVRRIALRPYENSVDVSFVGIELGTGRSLEYEYKLEGAQRDWQPLRGERSIRFASLAPGAYRLLVRAINSEGALTDPPASVELFVATPVLRRWWSLVLMAAALAALLYVAHQRRMRHVLELERVRTRIATDLHDDIGSSLSQIAILSEVARRESEKATPQVARPLSEITVVSGELVDSMSDIVWAINPKHDQFSNLEHRMRRFATDVLTARSIGLEFRAIPTQPDLRVGVEIRRQVFLMFKEAVNNVARHSHASLAVVEFGVEQECVILRVTDNGIGFDPAAGTEGNGNGLVNMRKRASDLGGTAIFESLSDRGTTITLRIPLTCQSWWGLKSRK